MPFGSAGHLDAITIVGSGLTPSPSSPQLEALTAGVSPVKIPTMRVRGLFVALVGLVALGPASCVPATSDQLSSDVNHTNGVTWSKNIAPMFQQHCQGRHRPGDIAPFPLVSYLAAYRER
jgi:hypothetical protein